MRFPTLTALGALGGQLAACSGGTGEDDFVIVCHCSLDADIFSPDADRGSSATPHRVSLDGLPYTHSDSTTASTTRVFDSYECNPGIDESGSEVWYDLSIDHLVPVRISLTSEPDVDVDLYLLVFGEEGTQSTCLASGDFSLEATVPPGRNVLVVDTPRNAGVERPGAYELSIVAAP